MERGIELSHQWELLMTVASSVWESSELPFLRLNFQSTVIASGALDSSLEDSRKALLLHVIDQSRDF